MHRHSQNSCISAAPSLLCTMRTMTSCTPPEQENSKVTSLLQHRAPDRACWPHHEVDLCRGWPWAASFPSQVQHHVPHLSSLSSSKKGSGPSGPPVHPMGKKKLAAVFTHSLSSPQSSLPFFLKVHTYSYPLTLLQWGLSSPLSLFIFTQGLQTATGPVSETQVTETYRGGLLVPLPIDLLSTHPTTCLQLLIFFPSASKTQQVRQLGLNEHRVVLFWNFCKPAWP